MIKPDYTFSRLFHAYFFQRSDYVPESQPREFRNSLALPTTCGFHKLIKLPCPSLYIVLYLHVVRALCVGRLLPCSMLAPRIVRRRGARVIPRCGSVRERVRCRVKWTVACESWRWRGAGGVVSHAPCQPNKCVATHGAKHIL